MKKYLIILLMILLASCKDEKRPSSTNLHENEVGTSETIPPGNIQKEREALQTEKEEPQPVAADFSGKYRKVVNGEPTEDCNCNCIDVNFDSPTEWCIVKDKISITARCERTGENTADVYFISASKDEDPDRKLPWEDFDIDQPIASIKFQPNGDAEVDWKGFMTDGKLAADYAIYGKKTLEGTYRKE